MSCYEDGDFYEELAYENELAEREESFYEPGWEDYDDDDDDWDDEWEGF